MYIIYLIIVLILIIYNTTSLYLIVPFILAILNFIAATINLIDDHKSQEFRFIQLISLIFIIIIIIIDIKELTNSLYSLSIIGLSINNNFKKLTNNRSISTNRITYFHDLIPNDICILNNTDFTIFHFSDSLDVKHFLAKLNEDTIYIVNFEFVLSLAFYDSDGPTINLSKPILITKNSNPVIVSKFIHGRIQDCLNRFQLNYSYPVFDNTGDGPGVIVKFRKVTIF